MHSASLKTGNGKHMPPTKGRRNYNREYQRLRRAEKKGEVIDVPGIVAGKYLKVKRRIEK
jgi:hypothetical protein